MSRTEAGRAVAAAMDTLLNSVFDYQAVDLECKREDKKLYETFIAENSTHEWIVAKWKDAYRGFDCGATDCAKDSEAGGAAPTGDWAKVVLWQSEQL